MPKRKDIKKILVIGAGPIIIGQACEFDYSGTQACKALKDEGYKVILINSNPATIMTDPGVADKTYIEPITLQVLEEVIKKEKPDAILPTMGGQTALNKLMLANKFEFSKLSGQKVNVMVFPNLDSANITYKVIKELDDAMSIGPIMMGMDKPVHILQLKASVDEIVNMSAIAVVDAQNRKY